MMKRAKGETKKMNMTERLTRTMKKELNLKERT
jgi:hypothetical protein